MSTIVFLGGGRITSAMLAGLRLGETRHRLVVHDRNPAKLRALKRSYGVVVESDLQRAVAKADLLVVAVRPDSVRSLLRSVGHAKRSLLIVSLAAGVPFRRLKTAVSGPLRWARAMPSPACRSGRGLTALAFSRDVRPRDRKMIRRLFSSFGQIIEIRENQFDAFTITFSPSHGLHALSSLAAAGERIGLDRKTALLAGAHALADSIVAWREGKHSLQSLVEEAATPGGTAAATMAGMDAAGYRRAVQRGLRNGLRRARANASL